MHDQKVVGDALARVLPENTRPWYRTPHLLKLNLLLVVPLLSSAIAGYDGSLMNGLQALPSWQKYFGYPKGHVLGAVNAAQAIGSCVALPAVGVLADRVGRRKTLLLGAIFIIVASIIQTAAVNFGMFTFSRVLVGMGTILVVQPSPMLISELCYPTHRGKYTSLFWTMFYLGSIMAAWCTYGTQKNLPDSQWAWRGPSLLQASFPVIQLCFWWYLPESPRWLVANARKDEARAILACYHTGGDATHALVNFEMDEIESAIMLERSVQTSSWKSLVSTPGNRKRTLITVLLGIFSQWCGSSVVSYYLTLVLNSVGVTNPDTQTLINGLLQLFNFIAAITAAVLVDRLGRRLLWNWSGIGMLISFIIWTACSATFANSDGAASNSLGIAVIAFIFVYYLHYDIAYTPLVLAYPTEILPYTIRSKGLSLELGIIYGSLVVLAFINPVALDAIGWKWYIFFCIILAISVVCNWFLLPETRGHSLEEISELFDGPQILAESSEGKAELGNNTSTVHVDKVDIKDT